jgi:hypothetical protein
MLVDAVGRFYLQCVARRERLSVDEVAANLRHTAGYSWVGGAPRVPHNTKSGVTI